MVEGLCSEIEYIDTGGICRTAYLENTDVSGAGTPFPSATDPSWRTREQSGAVNNASEYLSYITMDESVWWSKLRCHYTVAPPGPSAGPFIANWFEHKSDALWNGRAPDDEHNHTDESYELIFLDWNRQPWRITNTQIRPPFPRQPVFNLTRVR